jgi:acid stress chaperone HdeB
MNKILLAACALAGLAIAAPVEARKSKQSDNIDFSTISCAQFMDDLSRASEDDAGAVLLWLDGYLSGVSGDTVLRFDSLEAFATNLTERCSRRGRERLLDAARNVGLE